MLSNSASDPSEQNNLMLSESEGVTKDQKTVTCDTNTENSSGKDGSPNQGSANNMNSRGQSNPTNQVPVPGQATGTRHLRPWENIGNPQQSVPVDRILEFLMQSLHLKQKEIKDLKDHCAHLELKIRMDSYEKKVLPTTSKEPILRSKSAPESSKFPDFRKSSAPEIFLFPDTKYRNDKSVADNKNQNREDVAKNIGSSPVSADGLSSTGDSDLQSSEKDSCEFQSLRDSFQEPPGVSAQYFNNVINELMKTKICLNNLQMKQKAQSDGAANEKEMEKMRTEIQQLRLTNQKLKRDLDAKEAELAEMAKLEAEPVAVKDESFELSAESDPDMMEQSKDESNPSSQGSTEAEIQRLREEVEELTTQNQVIKEEKKELESILMKDNHDINRELIQLNDAYDVLKENVKILSKCLQEEKARSKKIDEKLRIKTEETRKISAQLGRLRQHYEELQQEKKAMEKTRSLEESPSMRFSSSRSRTVSSETNRSGGSNRSGELPRYGSNQSNYSPFNSRSSNYDSYNIRPEKWPPRLTQNDLSSGEQEPKMSNLPQFGAASAPKFECPRCWQRFQVENSYLIHLQSCLE
ncbi:CAP-Gly domain-containing linker protein 1-like isoform X1 [Mercenaria mercenaria]|uniref:CAP-Gly domain-containing linker protein 1-like isoform X1 n=1 Tax=Mercenaria mercenaria TaxID=6596 RepID=UPI00234F1BF0|nr:CAP-Gly domain-containing linker protein 1-like isoform X1 [Mercenaria mercenaria]